MKQNIEFFYNLSQFLYLSLAINIWGPECSSCRLCGHPSSLPLSSEDSADVFSSSVTRRRQYYLLNSRLLRAIIICPIAFLVWQIRFNMFYKVLIDTQKWAECFKILQNLSEKSSELSKIFLPKKLPPFMSDNEDKSA